MKKRVIIAAILAGAALAAIYVVTRPDRASSTEGVTSQLDEPKSTVVAAATTTPAVAPPTVDPPHAKETATAPAAASRTREQAGEPLPVLEAADLADLPASEIVVPASDVPEHDPYDVIDATRDEREAMRKVEREFNEALREVSDGQGIRAATEAYQRRAAEVLGEDRAEVLMRVLEQKGKDLVEGGATIDPFLIQ